MGFFTTSVTGLKTVVTERALSNFVVSPPISMVIPFIVLAATCYSPPLRLNFSRMAFRSGSVCEIRQQFSRYFLPSFVWFIS